MTEIIISKDFIIIKFRTSPLYCLQGFVEVFVTHRFLVFFTMYVIITVRPFWLMFDRFKIKIK